MFRYGLILMTICLSAALVLSVTHKFTQAKIEAQIEQKELASLEEIFPEADGFKQEAVDEQGYYRVESGKRLIGYVVKVQAKGYASDIDMLVGIDSRGTIKGIKITSHQETPGLGDKIVEIKPAEDKPWFLTQFEGRKVHDLSLEDLDAITGATITSEAVINSVKNEVTKFLTKVK